MKTNRFMKRLLVFAIVFTMALGNMSIGGAAYATDGGQTDSESSGLKEKVMALFSSEDEEESEELDDTETELQALGFDTDEMPEGYDEDSDENPNGSEYKTMQEISELLIAGSDGSTLYGDNGKLEDKYDDFFADKKQRSGIVATNDSFTIAEAGCFDGNGRKNDLAYLTIDNANNVNLRIYNSRNDSSSEAIKVDQLTDANQKADYMKSIDLCTGDFDGDNLDEIAVISAGADQNVTIYKIIADNVESNKVSSWKKVWTYSIDTSGIRPHKPYNSLDLASGDVDGDGTDDLIASWGTVKLISESTGKIDGANTTESKSVILYGEKNGNMLRKTQKISYGSESLCRVAFTIGDIDENGETEVLLGGSSIEQAVLANDNRTVGCYVYDKGTERLECKQMQTVKVIQGTKDNSDSSNPNKWVSSNGFDGEYLSLPGMKANISIVQLNGKNEGYLLYLDSVLYKLEDQFTIVDELDDSGKKLHEDKPYYEFGAAGAFMAGPATQGVTVNRIVTGNQRYTCDTVYDNGGKTIKNNLDTDTISRNSLLTKGKFFTNIDTDQDSAVMRYTGRHKMIYSSPRVCAFLASAPYFEDVAEHVDGGSDIKDFSNTAWGSSSSKGDVSGGTCSIAVGPSFTSETFLTSQSELNFSYQHTYTNTTTDYDEYAINYSTIAGEDCVVFFSVPGATYEYEVEYMNVDDDGNYEQETRKQYVTIPYQPVSQTISLETYNEIQEENPALPELEGTAIKSKCGDPASYPSSTNGYKDATVYDGDWSAPSFSMGGDVTQEITKGKDTDTEHTNEAGLDFTLVWGTEAFRGGGHFDAMGGGVTGEAKSESTTASGTVYNMPPAAKGYDYYFSWKLMKYNYEDENGNTFPVVTYLTKDVTKPPTLPTNFRQDYVNTSDSQVALTWSRNDSSVTAYDIYRHNEFTEGANDELIGTVKAGDYQIRKNKNGELVYDEETGETIKDYIFIDTGRSDYTEYEYRIQARRAKAPDISVPSAPITCKTRATFHPQVNLSDTSLMVYYDTIHNVTANVAEDDNFIFKNKSFQWQKYNSKTGLWDDLVTQTASTLKFSKCTLSTKGEYRCRVNSEISALGNTYRITAYSETLDVDYSKRDVAFGDVSCEESADGKSVTFTIPINNCKDGARTEPQGNIEFALSDGQNENILKGEIDSKTNTASATFVGLADGAYELTTKYVGNSKTFRDATNPDTFMYMRNMKSGKWLSLKKSYVFGEKLMDSLKLYDIENEGALGISKTDITDTVSKVVLKYKGSDSNEYEYATFLKGEDSAIPGIIYKHDYSAYSDVPTELTAYVYSGDELVQKKIFKIKKGNATLYVDDIEIDAGSDR
ncbi:MAG: VCBS repeat-containing protein, partial [Eubacterium sp.]|nr:VCBS repeat-containing protein [Candidatus Colimonas fimequi]